MPRAPHNPTAAVARPTPRCHHNRRYIEELICNSLEEYLEKAVMLAGDDATLTAVRDKIAAGRQTSPLFDTLKFCRHLEAAYQGMWEIALAGEAPRDFEVPA